MPSDQPTPTRRDVLEAAPVLALPALASQSRATDATDGIPAPFDAIPTIDDPTEQERSFAAVQYPPHAVPDDGPVPDYSHEHTLATEITVPPWALEAAAYRLRRRFEAPQGADGPADAERYEVEGFLYEYAQVHERFVTPDGRDAVDALLAALQKGEHGD